MVKKATQNDVAWEKIFKKRKLLDEIGKRGFAEVSALELKQYREPRLMAKLDHSSSRPEIFKKNDLVVLSNTNSSYLVGPFDLYQQLPDWGESGPNIELVKVPAALESINVENITSENSVLFSALSSGMAAEFAGESLQPTTSGRMRTGKFSFSTDHKIFGKHEIYIDGTQVEIDAGLEGDENFYVFEIKNHIAVDFNKRQLYFPYRLWKERVSKPIRLIYLTYSNDIFEFCEYVWSDLSDMSSCSIGNRKRYSFEKRRDEKFSLYEWALKQEEIGSRILSEAPFPQADNFERVIDLVSLLIENPKSSEELAEHYDFDTRQSDYYFNAAKFLGLAELKRDKMRGATSKAVEIYSQSPKSKYTDLAKLLLQSSSIRRSYLELRNHAELSAKEVTQMIRDSGEAERVNGESTLNRRSQTVLSWANWLKSNLD